MTFILLPYDGMLGHCKTLVGAANVIKNALPVTQIA